MLLDMAMDEFLFVCVGGGGGGVFVVGIRLVLCIDFEFGGLVGFCRL